MVGQIGALANKRNIFAAALKGDPQAGSLAGSNGFAQEQKRLGHVQPPRPVTKVASPKAFSDSPATRPVSPGGERPTSPPRPSPASGGVRGVASAPARPALGRQGSILEASQRVAPPRVAVRSSMSSTSSPGGPSSPGASPKSSTKLAGSRLKAASDQSSAKKSLATSAQGKRCVKCGENYKGFGDACGTCRSQIKGVEGRCAQCGGFFHGYGTVCDECRRRDQVARLNSEDLNDLASFGGSDSERTETEDAQEPTPGGENSTATSLHPPAAEADELALMSATCAGNQPQVTRLCAAGAAVNEANYEGVTPLLCASIMGNEALVAVLLEARADANTSDKFGSTPLQAAAFDGRSAVVRLLLGARATVDAQDSEGFTALHFAVRNTCGEPGYKDVLKSLVDGRADPTVKAKDGTSARSAAQEYSLTLDFLRHMAS